VNWGGIVILLSAIALWLWATLRYMARPTPGRRIEPRPGTAVLLVDLQEVFWTDASYGPETRARVEAAVAREVALAQQRDQPVIALRQEWSGFGPRLIAMVLFRGTAVKGSAGTGLATPFVGMADHVVIKRVQDGFETGELDALLAALTIGKLRIMGLDGEHGVAKTAQAALNRGYDVELVSDGIATARPGAFETVRTALGGQGARVV
jgi:nicotinamidase/pyrazinamidase